MPIRPPAGYTNVMTPTQLGPYTIQSRLGRGGMGAVYEAVDTTSGDTVAVKVLASHLADDPGVRSRFEAEIEALKNLRHPGIVRLLAFGEQDDQPFFAMELVRGKSLEQILRAGRRFTWRETVAMAIEITRALKVAHDNGIVHRDLKPANLLVADLPAGTEPVADRVTVKLADFGIAKLFGGVGHTALGHVVGTAEYMAPEQAAGRPIDHRADLYALGLVMYAMLTGSPPFRGTQLTEVIDKQRRATAPRVASLVADVPAELDELVARLLSKEPAQRPASALALGRLLMAIETLHSPTNLPPTGSPALAPGTSQPKQQTTPNAGVAPSHGRAVPTAHERSNRATQPVDAISQTGPARVPGRAVPGAVPPPKPDKSLDLLAPTQALPTPLAAKPPVAAKPPTSAAQAPRGRPTGGSPRPTAGSTDITQDFTGRSAGPHTAASASPAGVSRLSTDVASATTLVDRSQRNQFITIAEAERAAEEKARREHLWQLLFQGLTAAVLLISVVGGGWLLMKPLSVDQLYGRIMAVANDPHGDRRDVRDEIELFLTKYAADPRAGDVATIKQELDRARLELRLRRAARGDKMPAPAERDYRAAMTSEKFGPSACMKALEAMLAVHTSGATESTSESGPILDLARWKVEQLRPQAVAEQQEDGKRIAELLAAAASLAARADIANDDAARKKLAGQRQGILENLVEVYAQRPHAEDAVAFATRELAASPTRPQAATAPPSGAD
jgi:serine/threonine protein kinase